MLYQLSYAHQISKFFFSVCSNLPSDFQTVISRARQESNLRPAA
jgi:hypothetical protein